MSHIFDEFMPEDSSVFDVSQFENDTQRLLRDDFDLLAAENLAEIEEFEPSDPRSVRHLLFLTGEDEFEDEEPLFTNFMMHEMLKKCGLNIPADNDDPRVIKIVTFRNGVRNIFFNVAREEDSVPVYCETADDGETPTKLCLYSFNKMQYIVDGWQERDEQRERLSQKLTIDWRLISRLDTVDLKQFNATFDDIQKL